MNRLSLVALLTALVGIVWDCWHHRDSPESHLRRGIELVIAGRNREAIAEFDAALDRGGTATPDVVLAARSMAKGNRGDLAGAFADANAAIELNPRSAHGFLSRASVYYMRWKALHALSDCNTLLEIDPECFEGLLLRGLVLDRLGRMDEAAADFAAAVRCRPDLRERVAQVKAAAKIP